MSSSTASSSSFSKPQQRGPGGVAAAPHEADDQTARTVLTQKGFDPDDIHQACVVTGGWQTTTPLFFFSAMGTVTMMRYLISIRGADGRQTDAEGRCPMYWAAANGRVDTIQWLAQDGGAHDDIRRVTSTGISPISPLRIALHRGHVEVAKLLILLGALSPKNGGIMEDRIMRRDLCHEGSEWSEDKRRSLLSWAHQSVAAVPVLLTGTIVSAASASRRPPPPPKPYDATRRHHKRQKRSHASSPLVVLNGKSGILELIAHYVAGTPHQVRTLQQLITRLPVFMADVPFVEDD